MRINDKWEFIKNKIARNRIALPPMDTLMAEEGVANEFHIQHYGARAYGGVGTIIVESTAILSEGRIRDKDLGLWNDEQIEPLAKVAKVIKMGGALAGIQLNHAGSKSEVADIDKKGATFKYSYLDQTRLSLVTIQELSDIEEKFVQAARRAKDAGFDFIELHGAHGYLLNQLMHKDLNEVIKSPSLIERSKNVINIVKRIFNEVKIPIGMRFSFTDHVQNGMEVKDYESLIKELEKYLVYLNVSSGETLSRVRSDELIKVAGTKLFRIPVAKEVKKITSLPLFVAGNVLNKEDVNEMLKAGIECALVGRELIFSPNLVVNNLLDVSEINKDDYHWNNNIWYNHHDYLELMKLLKLK